MQTFNNGCGSSASARIPIMGNYQSQRPEDIITQGDEATNSVSAQMNRIEDNLVIGHDVLNSYKDEANNLRN